MADHDDDDRDTPVERPSRRPARTPAEHLRRLEQEPGAYQELLDAYEGDPLRAAHELARVEQIVCAGIDAPPTAGALHAAYLRVHQGAGLLTRMPSRDAIVADALAVGLDVAGH